MTACDRVCKGGKAQALLLEPDPEVFLQLQKKQTTGQKVSPAGVHDGQKHILHICRSRALNSFLEADYGYLSLFPGFAYRGEVIQRREVQTVRLDDEVGASELSFLKLGLQGSELTVLQHGEQALQRAVVLQMQLSPVPLYRDGSSLSSVSAWLERRGWMLYSFLALHQRQLKPLGADTAPDKRGSCCMQAETVFIPAFRRWDALTELQLGELAFWAREVLCAADLAERALWTLDQRDQGKRLEAFRTLPKDAALLLSGGTAPRILPR